MAAPDLTLNYGAVWAEEEETNGSRVVATEMYHSKRMTRERETSAGGRSG